MVGVHADGTKDLLNRGKDIGVLSIWQNEAVLLVRVGSDGVEMVSLLSFCTKWPGHFAEYNQPVATFLNIFISVRHCTCFRRFFPSIIRSSKLHIQRQVFVRPLLLPAASQARLAAGSSNGPTKTWRCMCSFELLMMDGKDPLKHVQCLTEINKLWNVASCWLYSANSFVISVRLSVRKEHLGSHWTEFREILYLSICPEYSRLIKTWQE